MGGWALQCEGVFGGVHHVRDEHSGIGAAKVFGPLSLPCMYNQIQGVKPRSDHPPQSVCSLCLRLVFCSGRPTGRATVLFSRPQEVRKAIKVGVGTAALLFLMVMMVARPHIPTPRTTPHLPALPVAALHTSISLPAAPTPLRATHHNARQHSHI